MKRFISLAIVAIVAVVAIAHHQSARAATSTLTAAISAQNGSGETGTATFTQMGADVKVDIALKGAPATAQPAHVHDGTCADLKGPVYPLTSITGGTSTSMLKGVTIDDLLKTPHAINVHDSAADLGKYVACGNIVAQ